MATTFAHASWKWMLRFTATACLCTLCACAGVRADKPAWSQGKRFERVGQIEIQGTPEQIFPLLCPVREYEWLPDWACTMFYSQSGVAELNAVFQTKELLGLKVTWIVISYEPDTFIEFLLVTGQDVVRFSSRLEEVKPGTTRMTWRMLFTLNSTPGKVAIRQAFSEVHFRKMLDDRQKQLNYYLKTGKMIGKE